MRCQKQWFSQKSHYISISFITSTTTTTDYKTGKPLVAKTKQDIPEIATACKIRSSGACVSLGVIFFDRLLNWLIDKFNQSMAISQPMKVVERKGPAC